MKSCDALLQTGHVAGTPQRNDQGQRAKEKQRRFFDGQCPHFASHNGLYGRVGGHGVSRENGRFSSRDRVEEKPLCLVPKPCLF
jgi:hypothetical protein